MLFSRLLSFLLRALELVWSIIILGIFGYLLKKYPNDNNNSPRARFIYTEVIAGVSALFSLVWLIPTTWSFMHYPLDLFISIGQFASFGVLYQFMSSRWNNCKNVNNSNNNNNSFARRADFNFGGQPWFNNGGSAGATSSSGSVGSSSSTSGVDYNTGLVTNKDLCNIYKAGESFVFMLGVFWLVSSLLSIHVFHKVARKGRGKQNYPPPNYA